MDKIASCVPSTITLTQLELNPTINTDGKIHFNENNVLITGLGPSSKDVNAFIQKLQETSAFKEVNLGYIKMLKNSVEYQISLNYD